MPKPPMARARSAKRIRADDNCVGPLVAGFTPRDYRETVENRIDSIKSFQWLLVRASALPGSRSQDARCPPPACPGLAFAVTRRAW
jgi:hypothetical protein